MVVSDIKCLLVFGSHARGDNDEYSDHDICVFVKCGEYDKSNVNEIVLNLVNLPLLEVEKVNIVIYDEDILDLMLENGSLFLWHLKFESSICYGDEFFKEKILKLEEFTRHIEDLLYYSEIFVELQLSYKQISKDNVFDFSLLFTIVRNICMLLCHKNKRYKFGRRDVFESCLQDFAGFPIDISDYDFLAAKKIQYERGIVVQTNLNPKNINSLLTKVEILITYAKERFSIT